MIKGTFQISGGESINAECFPCDSLLPRLQRETTLSKDVPDRSVSETRCTIPPSKISTYLPEAMFTSCIAIFIFSSARLILFSDRISRITDDNMILQRGFLFSAEFFMHLYSSQLSSLIFHFGMNLWNYSYWLKNRRSLFNLLA